MKKILVLIIVIFLSLVYIQRKNEVSQVINYDANIDNIYLLNFNNEVLSTNNFKLKIAPFTGYTYIIRKIYPKYNRNIKTSYTYDFRDLDEGVENFKNDYIRLLRENNLYDEVDKAYSSGIIISKVEIYTTKEALKKFLKKYSKVKYEVLTENYNSM